MILRSLLNMTLLQYMKLYQQSTMYSGLQRTFRIMKVKENAPKPNAIAQN